MRARFAVLIKAASRRRLASGSIRAASPPDRRCPAGRRESRGRHGRRREAGFEAALARPTSSRPPTRAQCETTAPRHGTGSGSRGIRNMWKRLSMPRLLATSSASRTSLLFPIPGGPTTPTTDPRPADRALEKSRSRCAVPTRVLQGSTAQARPSRSEATPSRRRARHGRVGTLDRHPLRFAEKAARPTSCAVESLNMTPPGGAADSMRCAIPTCSPDSGVTNCGGTEFTSDHLARTSALSAGGAEHHPADRCVGGHILDFPWWISKAARQARKGVILELDRRSEHRHDAVAGEFGPPWRRSAGPPPSRD